MHELTTQAAAAAGYVFPNDVHVHWTLMIVLYPYITGIVAGAFIVSSMYHVFHVQALKPLARFSLLFAFAFLACATLPLLMHLGQPGRAFSMFLTPNPTSAMAGFGYFYAAYGMLLVLEIFFIYRPTLVARHQAARGIKRTFYLLLSMASDNLSAEALEMDRRIIRVLAALGIPMACILHGYVGFIFGGIKANPLWATPLMPVIFLLSACGSGIAGILLAYFFLMRSAGRDVDPRCVRSSLKFLWGFFLLNFSFEMLEVFSHGYLATSHWDTVYSLLWGPLAQSYWVWQVMVFSVIPILLMGYVNLAGVNGKVLRVLAPLSSVMILLQVLFMRWNVVIGGQLISRSERGTVFYQPGWLEKEGILLALVVLVLPLLVLYVLGRVFPFWQDEQPSAISGPTSLEAR
jgi:Ni/Fe-hydrogenase subunit HybB-like protein